MCATCGCSSDGAVLRLPADLEREHPGHEHPGQEHPGQEHPGHEHPGYVDGGLIAPADTRTVALQRKVLAKNDGIAAATRAWLAERGVFMLNLMSSPGAGKTTLLEHTGRELAGRLDIAVIEGDLQTALDARRVSAAGCRVIQINTGAGCHLDAQMVSSALRALDPAPGSLVVVENVGNLVCPALFDLGEAARVVLSAVTEGADKPVKYPQMFRQADLIVMTKIDLLPYVDFDTARYEADIAGIAPSATLLKLSAVTGAGLPAWYTWLTAAAPASARPARAMKPS